MSGVAFLALAASANAASVTLRAAHVFPQSLNQSGVVFDQFAEEVSKRTNGEVTINVVHGGALLGTGDQLDGVSTGLVDIVSLFPYYFPGEFRIEGALTNIVDIWTEEPLDLPGVITVHQKLHSEDEHFREEYERRGVKMLFPMAVDPYVIACQKPVAGLADLEGLKMRGFGRYFPILLQGLGVESVVVPAPEAYSATSTGLINCHYTTPDFIYSNKWHEVAPHLLIPSPEGPARPQAFTTGVLAMNAASFDRLTPEQQQVIEEVSAELATQSAERMASVYSSAIERILAEGGGTMNVMSQVDFDIWRERTPNLLDLAAEHLNEAGYDGAKIIARYRELAAEYLAQKGSATQD